MSEFTISNLKPINAPANKSGNALLATFDLKLSGLGIKGCALVNMNTGQVVAYLPVGENKHGNPFKMWFIDCTLRDRVTDRAAAAYMALTGLSVAKA